MPLRAFVDRMIFGPSCPFCREERMLPVEDLPMSGRRFRCARCQTTVSEFRPRSIAEDRPMSAIRQRVDRRGAAILDDEASNGT